MSLSQSNTKLFERVSSLDSDIGFQHSQKFNNALSNNPGQSLTKVSPSSSSTYFFNELDNYELDIYLKEGKNLAVRDSNGLSDPYVKVLLNGSNVYKSKTILKNLNPQWNERFTLNLTKNNRSKKNLSPSSVSINTTEGNETKILSSEYSSNSNSSEFSESSNLNALREQYDDNNNNNFGFLSKIKLKMIVYDYDRLRDDLIGSAKIDLTKLKENE
jgi:Ca2+-dependent lipid-binding protein